MRARALRHLTAMVHRIDHAIGRIGQTRRVLVEVRTPVYKAVLGPITDVLQDLPDVDVTFTSEYPARIKPLVGAARFITHRQAEWTRFDLYLNADPWAAARLRRCARRINFFHGVAGKYDLDNPVGLPMGFEYYDRVAFINQDRMQRYLDARVVTRTQAALVGYPKLDRLALGLVDGPAIRHALGLDPARPTVLYAPTYSPASSLHLAGERIITSLDEAGLNVIVKLHDRSLDTDRRYNAGIDWRKGMRALQRPGRIAYVEGPDSSPYLAAADVMVTDHSSVGFEFLVLDRPLIVFDAPGLAEAARINPEKISLLRCAATVVTTCEELARAARHAVLVPSERSTQRQRVAGQMFHDPGRATGRAVALIQALLDAPAGATETVASRREPHAQTTGGGLS